MRYCQSCILPDSRPNLIIHENGICDPCSSSSSDKKDDIDWAEREKSFQLIVNEAKAKNAEYDCLIPVSGGKDSTWQVVKALEYDLRPLAITWKTAGRNSLGQKNLENLISIGVDHIDFSINPKVERLFTLKAFKKYGIPLIPMHMAIHAIPMNMALQLNIPLIIQGENSAFEYGGEDSLKGFTIDHAYLKKFGVTNGTTSKDWIDDELSEKDLTPYHWPSDEEITSSGLKYIFLGQFFRWDPVETYRVASEHGFQAGEEPKTGFYDFADIDDEFLITIHHWLKWYKFGFTRLWDNLSLEIRYNRMTRDKAIDIVKQKGPDYPQKEISDFCEYTNIDEQTFLDIAGTFRNKEIWSKNADGIWHIKDFLVEDWPWDKG